MVKKIYTKTGDGGFTSLLGGTKVPKNDWRIEAYGTVDELNSFIGLLGDKLHNSGSSFSFSFLELEKIQNNLFKIGSVLSYDMTADLKIELPNVKESDVKDLENWMDTMELTLEPLKNFILPGGNEAVSLAHVCRTVSRRAERHTVQAIQYPIITKYINRLSDYFFMLSRYIASELGVKEKIWKG
jgi:cob(I)alamin adenosyltransferase